MTDDEDAVMADRLATLNALLAERDALKAALRDVLALDDLAVQERHPHIFRPEEQAVVDAARKLLKKL